MVLFFLFFKFSSAQKKEDAKKKHLKQKGKSGTQKWEGKARAWKKAFLSLHLFFSLCFFFLFFLPFEKKMMPGESIWNKRVKTRAKSQKVEEELERKLPPFSVIIFFVMIIFFFVLFSFLLLEKKKMSGENVWNKRVKAGAKSERVEQELEKKLPPVFAILFFRYGFFCCFFVCFVFFVFKKKKMTRMCYYLLLWCYYSKESNGKLLPSLSFSVVFKQRKQQELATIAFFFVLKKKKTMAMCCRLLLWCCGTKKATITNCHCLLPCV